MADIGSVLGGRYRLIELLGQGGMATIYRGRDSQLERDVAVKVLRPEYGRDPDFFARFRQEAQSAASLNHPGVVAVYDYGTDEAGPFIVMELVDGEDLASIVRRSGALPPRQAARLTAGIARAIEAAHERGFVHRDIKPGNVLVTRDGQVKVTDFGIARAIAEAQLTLPGTTLGSVHYFSPEQARGETTTPASDIYSLGIVLYELLAGRRPWEGDSAAAIATARLTGSVPSPSAVRSGIPPALEQITRKALALDPDARFGSAGEMATALEDFLAHSGRGAGAAAGGAAGAAGAVAAMGAAGGADPGRDDPVGAGAGLAAAGAGIAAADAARAAAGEVPDVTLAGSANLNPGARIPYPEDAYAGSRRYRAIEEEEVVEDERGGASPWLWLSGLLALAILAVAGFLIFQLISGRTPGTGGDEVEVPNFVGLTYEQAIIEADRAGLELVRAAFEPSEEEDGTILSQDPEAGELVEEGTVIELTLALGDESVSVPDLRGRTESEAVNLIAAAGLEIGTRTTAFDPFIPQGSIVSQDPPANQPVPRQTRVNYVVSDGPEPTPTPSPSPSPSPTPEPTLPPTPPPTPPPPTPPPPTPPPPTPPPTEPPPTAAPTDTPAPAAS